MNSTRQHAEQFPKINPAELFYLVRRLRSHGTDLRSPHRSVTYSDPFGLCPPQITGRPCSGWLATGVGMIPLAGDAIDILGAARGRDLLTGETISGVGVAATVLGTVFGSGRAGREVADEVIELHHLLPQAREFQEFFRNAGLDIEKYKMPLTRAAHRLKPYGLHTGSENWNKVWRDFMRENPEATRNQIRDQLKTMMRDFHLR